MKPKYFLTFKGDVAVRALGRRLKEGDRIKITPEQARQFNNPRAKELGIRIVKVEGYDKKKLDTRIVKAKENDEKKKEVKKSWPKK